MSGGRKGNQARDGLKPGPQGDLDIFTSEVVDRVRSAGNVWSLPRGEILLPRVFGFCRGVKRALRMLTEACRRHCRGGKVLYLLGQIIHNPWVNEYFERRCVRILQDEQIAELGRYVGAGDCMIIPAFGVVPEVERRLAEIGCQVVDTTCGDVRRLWVWAERAAAKGFAVMIFGRARHDETVVTKRRLAEAGGQYLVVGSLDDVNRFCRMIAGAEDPQGFAEAFDPQATNADSLEPFGRLAQVSQTTMLHDATMEVRRLLEEAFAGRFGPAEAKDRLLLQPTVCRATQDRQAAAVELCGAGLDLVVVVGGFGSSNTRHLYELAREYAPTVFLEDASAILSEQEVRALDPGRDEPVVVPNWLPRRRPLRLGVLAGASSPEVVVGQVLEKLAGFLR
jgi:4-hydroxy-3-methylbut-2-enyl diphosphate reductase